MKENRLEEKAELEAYMARARTNFWRMLGVGAVLYTLAVVGFVAYVNHKDSERINSPSTISQPVEYSGADAPNKNKLYHGSPEEIWAKMHPYVNAPCSDEPAQNK